MKVKFRSNFDQQWRSIDLLCMPKDVLVQFRPGLKKIRLSFTGGNWSEYKLTAL